MNHRVKKFAFTVMAHTAERAGDLVPVFVYDGEPFVGDEVIHNGANIGILII
jgi:hypothetical protein